MTKEELFQAIGEVEGSRLARTELTMQESSRNHSKEEPKVRKRSLRMLRHLFVAALIIGSLAVTAYAVGGYILFDSPGQMLTAIFGDKTGHDHGAYTEVPDPERPGSLLNVLPEFDRAEADPTVVQEDIAPYVSPVGKSITFHDMTLTVDSFMYDSATQCGLITYTLKNGPEYYLQSHGAVGYMGRSYPADFNQYGYSYIIEEKTTEDTLAAVYYFWFDPSHRNEDFYVTIDDGPTVEEMDAVYKQCMEETKTAYTREQAIEKAIEILGAEEFASYASVYNGWKEDVEGYAAYGLLRDYGVADYWEQNPVEECQEKIYFDCSESRELTHLTIHNGGITMSPMSILLDMEQLTFLHSEEHPINSDLIDSIVVRFADGTEYVVCKGNVDNTLFAMNTTKDGTMDTEYTKFVLMFNRIIDLDKVEAVILNDIEVKNE